ncbi:MAG: hypothetical protein ACD_19C00364G0002 [uncultured bacterium]|nr:MAG: hypothetical protein ACD_19C00364G0002 [uncultured bacterium]
MSNPAFIVDGFTEKLIIQKLCPGKPISRTDLNGKNVTIDAIAKKIASLIRLFNNRFYPIIILIDKEERDQSITEIIDCLNQKLRDNGIVSCDFRIGVADRMIENWIIADWDCLGSREFPQPECTEGINGSSMIRRVKGSYSKTTDGVELFLSANQQRIYENSESFRTFIDKISDLSCNYLNFR